MVIYKEILIIVIIMITTEEGQISLDFLLGISVFLLTLGFLIQFIPSLFLSTSEEGSLNSVAYRTANILVEDPGWWENSMGYQNGTDWETHIGNLSRIGLAADITPKTKQTITPNMLNKTKIKQIQNLNRTMLTNKLGLYDKINGAQVDYSYNITFVQDNKIMLMNNSPLFFGEKLPTSQDVFKITRKVLVETGKVASFRVDELNTQNPPNNTAIIDINGNQSEDVIIQITDFNFTGNTTFNSIKLNGSDLNIPSDYNASKRTETSGFVTYNDPLNNTDTLRLILNYSLFQMNTTYQLNIKFDNANFTLSGPAKYADKIEPFYEPASLVVMVWK
jgi:hypothetical protein